MYQLGGNNSIFLARASDYTFKYTTKVSLCGGWYNIFRIVFSAALEQFHMVIQARLSHYFLNITITFWQFTVHKIVHGIKRHNCEESLHRSSTWINNITQYIQKIKTGSKILWSTLILQHDLSYLMQCSQSYLFKNNYFQHPSYVAWTSLFLKTPSIKL